MKTFENWLNGFTIWTSFLMLNQQCQGFSILLFFFGQNSLYYATMWYLKPKL